MSASLNERPLGHAMIVRYDKAMQKPSTRLVFLLDVLEGRCGYNILATCSRTCLSGLSHSHLPYHHLSNFFSKTFTNTHLTFPVKFSETFSKSISHIQNFFPTVVHQLFLTPPSHTKPFLNHCPAVSHSYYFLSQKLSMFT
jgi:hypothetical protein